MPGEPKKAGEVIKEAFGPGDGDIALVDGDEPSPAAKAKKPKRPVVLASEAIGYFAGMPVLAMGMKLTKAGDGLSTPMTVKATPHDIGTRFYVVHEVEYRKGEHIKAGKDEHGKEIEGLRLVEVYDAIDGAIIDAGTKDAEWAAKLIARQKEANAKAEEAASGVQRLPLGAET